MSGMQANINQSWRDPRFWVLVTIGAICAFAGIFCPPVGKIDPSVLTLVGEFLILAGGIAGIDIHFNIKELLSRRGKNKENETD